MMGHKAFLFDYTLFEKELGPILEEALKGSVKDGLIAFIRENYNNLKNPYTGENLSEDMGEILKIDSVQELGDFALTKYYNPDGNKGLDDLWMDIDEKAPESTRPIFLGLPFGAAGHLFDPGAMGSYFQNKLQVENSLAQLDNYLKDNEFSSRELSALNVFRELLNEAKEKGMGVYITF